MFVVGDLPLRLADLLEICTVKRPEVLRQFGKWWIVRCPGCGLEARIDDDQYHGRVSIDCPACPYHETHDLSKHPRIL